MAQTWAKTKNGTGVNTSGFDGLLERAHVGEKSQRPTGHWAEERLDIALKDLLHRVPSELR